MLRQLRPALVVTLALTILTGLVYPLLVTGFAGLLFPRQAEGSLVTVDGRIIGSDLIAQDFSSPRYFHPRPSATVGPDPKDASKTVPAPYNAANSGGSNLGPTSKALIDRIRGDADRLKADNPQAQPSADVPADLVTTSASGLDPDITPEAAAFQVPRVARARDLPADRVAELVASHVAGRSLGLFGEAHVNVLDLNLALDALAKENAGKEGTGKEGTGKGGAGRS